MTLKEQVKQSMDQEIFNWRDIITPFDIWTLVLCMLIGIWLYRIVRKRKR